jgi:NAD(P)-dependent dehydrogenase (short-subunit alcohol dehydrogenase family)
MSLAAVPCYTLDNRDRPKGSTMDTLQGRTAIIYGGGGSIGAAVGAAFAREGAHVELVGRTEDTLARAARAITDAGGSAAVAALDLPDRPSCCSPHDHSGLRRTAAPE